MSKENPLENALNIEPRESIPEVSDTDKAQIVKKWIKEKITGRSAKTSKK